MTEDQQFIYNMINRGRHLVPDHMWGAVERYFIYKIEPGSFLMALLCDMPVMTVLTAADDINSENLPNWGKFLYNYVPAYAWGSKETVKTYLSGIYKPFP